MSSIEKLYEVLLLNAVLLLTNELHVHLVPEKKTVISILGCAVSTPYTVCHNRVSDTYPKISPIPAEFSLVTGVVINVLQPFYSILHITRGCRVMVTSNRENYTCTFHEYDIK